MAKCEIFVKTGLKRQPRLKKTTNKYCGHQAEHRHHIKSKKKKKNNKRIGPNNVTTTTGLKKGDLIVR